MLNRVQKGERVGRAMTAEAWNAFTDAANAHAIGGNSTKQIESGEIEQAVLTAKVNSTDTKQPCTVLGIDKPAVDPVNNQQSFIQRRTLDTETPNESHRGRFVVLQQAVNAGFLSLAAIGGVIACKLKTSDKSDWINYCDIDKDDDSQLITDPAGSCQVIWKSGTSGIVDAIIRFGMPQTRSYMGLAREDIQPNGSGNVELMETPTIASTYAVPAWLDWMHSDQQVSNGTECIVTWFPTEAKWRITHAACEDGGGGPALERGYEGPDA